MKNIIKNTHPEILQFLVNKEDAIKYSHASNKNIQCKCPICNFQKTMMVGNLCRRGFNCPICKDGISYPEKFIMVFLQALSIEFIYQLSKKDFNWCGKYRYDFYLIEHNCIIEVHGAQHYNNSFGFFKSRNVEETIENDKNKKNLALLNGIGEENYIIINAERSNKEWLIDSIKKTKLISMFDLSHFNWEDIDIKSRSSLVREVCEFYEFNKPIETLQIAEKFKISRDSVVRYLKIGKKYNFCSYDSLEARKKASEKGNLVTKQSLSKKVDVFKDGEFIKTYFSAKELYKRSLIDFGVQFCYSSICEVCRGEAKTHYGYVFKYKKR